MNSAVLLTLVQSIIAAFFSKNVAAEDISVILPELLNAFTSAKQGQAFSVSVALSVDGVAGEFTASWAPNAAPAA